MYDINRIYRQRSSKIHVLMVVSIYTYIVRINVPAYVQYMETLVTAECRQVYIRTTRVVGDFFVFFLNSMAFFARAEYCKHTNICVGSTILNV